MKSFNGEDDTMSADEPESALVLGEDRRHLATVISAANRSSRQAAATKKGAGMIPGPFADASHAHTPAYQFSPRISKWARGWMQAGHFSGASGPWWR